MTTTTDDSALSGYFTMEPLLGGGDDPFCFDTAWDANLTPDEYGDQSAKWDDDNASFTDSEDEEDDEDCLSQGSCDEGEWNIVYAASFTVVASTNGSPNNRRASSSAAPPALPPPQQLARRDSKVRFCDQPPKVVSYECCSREEYSQLYYSVHELQKIIDDLRLEKKTTPGSSSSSNSHSSNVATATNHVGPSRST